MTNDEGMLINDEARMTRLRQAIDDGQWRMTKE